MDTVKATIQPCEDVVVSKSPSRKFIVRKACRDDLDDVLDMIQVIDLWRQHTIEIRDCSRNIHTGASYQLCTYRSWPSLRSCPMGQSWQWKVRMNCDFIVKRFITAPRCDDCLISVHVLCMRFLFEFGYYIWHPQNWFVTVASIRTLHIRCSCASWPRRRATHRATTSEWSDFV